MAKILITGVNPVQCGHRPKMNYISFVLAVQGAFKDQGHEVTLAPVTPGDTTVASFDKVIVFLAPMRGFLCKHTLGALWAIQAGGNKVTLAFDDWQVPAAMSSIASFAASYDKLLTDNQFGYAGLEKVTASGTLYSELHATAESLCQESLPRPALIPAYRGGNLALLGVKGDLRAVNPSKYFDSKYGSVVAEGVESWRQARTTRWVVAALHDHQSWLKKQKLAWPRLEFGHKKSKQARVAESQIYNEYAASTGVISPAYKTAGSGWWRARFGLSADALSVAACASAEMPFFGNLYPEPAEVEKLSEAQLYDLANAQRNDYDLAAERDWPKDWLALVS